MRDGRQGRAVVKRLERAKVEARVVARRRAVGRVGAVDAAAGEEEVDLRPAVDAVLDEVLEGEVVLGVAADLGEVVKGEEVGGAVEARVDEDGERRGRGGGGGDGGGGGGAGKGRRKGCRHDRGFPTLL